MTLAVSGHLRGNEKLINLPEKQCAFKWFGVYCTTRIKPNNMQDKYCDYHDHALRTRLRQKYSGKRLQFKLRNLNKMEQNLANGIQPVESPDFTVDANIDPALYTPKQLQAEIDSWSRHMFGITENSQFETMQAGQVLLAIMLLGKMSHAILKKAQNIRLNEDHDRNYYIARMDLWDVVKATNPDNSTETVECITKNGYRFAQLLGMMEELGETVHELISGDKSKLVDGIGDLQVYLNNFCGFNGISAHDALVDTWSHVRQRNWKKNPNTGKA